MLATYRMYVNDGDKAIELASKMTSSQRVTNPQPYDLQLHPAETAGRLVAAISEIAPSSAVARLYQESKEFISSCRYPQNRIRPPLPRGSGGRMRFWNFTKKDSQAYLYFILQASCELQRPHPQSPCRYIPLRALTVCGSDTDSGAPNRLHGESCTRLRCIVCLACLKTCASSA